MIRRIGSLGFNVSEHRHGNSGFPNRTDGDAQRGAMCRWLWDASDSLATNFNIYGSTEWRHDVDFDRYSESSQTNDDLSGLTASTSYLFKVTPRMISAIDRRRLQPVRSHSSRSAVPPR